MTIRETRLEINKLDDLAKLSIYMHYYITARFDITNENHRFNVFSFEEFFSNDRIKFVDNGRNWKKKGYGKRFSIYTGGIYDWYWKFKRCDFKVGYYTWLRK